MNKIITLVLTFILVTSCAQDKNDVLVTISTSYGDMVAILYDETPKHKANFLKLAGEGYYNGLSFHRVIQGFMIQTGDSLSRAAKPGEPLGMGGKRYTIAPEFNPKFFHQKGALSAARMPDDRNPKRESSGSQFIHIAGGDGCLARTLHRNHARLGDCYKSSIVRIIDRAPGDINPSKSARERSR